MKRHVMFVLCLLMFSLCLVAVRFNQFEVKAPNGYRVHNLDTGLNYTSIQEAIYASETDDGHTILVDGDIYYEHVVVNKSLSLVGQNKSTTIIDGSGNGTVVTITRDNVNVTGFTIRNSGATPERGVYLDHVNHCHITGNSITNNTFGMRIWNSSNNNTISGNEIANNTAGIYLAGSSNNITGNNMLDNHWCIGLYQSSSNNLISGNNMANNDNSVSLYTSSNNTVSGNNITSYYVSFYLDRASDNLFCHNNVVDTVNHVTFGVSSENAWDNGVEGNYWSKYTGVDLDDGGDGIGDTPYEIDANNTDRFPLMGRFNSFTTSSARSIDVVSNSTIESFECFASNGTIRMYVSNMTTNQTFGFCRVRIPHAVINEPYHVTINGAEPYHCNYTLYDDGNNRWIYFEYEHSTLEIIIIPEFTSLLILPLFTVASLVALIIYKRKRPKSLAK